MDSELENIGLATTDIIGGPGANTINLNNERLDCENLDDLTERWIDPDRPSFVTVMLRFFGNMIVDCFRAVFS